MTTATARYQRHLDKLSTAVDGLSDLLAREHALVCQPPVAHAALQTLIEQKSVLAGQIEQLEQERAALAATLIEDRTASAAEVAERLDCDTAWQDLRQRIAAASQRNALNGMSIQIRLETTEARLKRLNQASRGGLYSAAGTYASGITGQRRGGA